MTVRPTRAALARAVLLLLAIATTLAFGETIRARASAASPRPDAITVHVADDAHAIAVVPTRAFQWVGNQLRDPHGDDRFVAVLLAVAALLLLGAWRRAARLPGRTRAVLAGPRAASRAPPAFV